MEPVPSAPVSVKALRCASTASAALRGLDRHLRSGWWLDMRSMRFSILKRIGLQNVSAGSVPLCNVLEQERSGISIARVTARLRSFTLELCRLLKVSFQYDRTTIRGEVLIGPLSLRSKSLWAGSQTPWQHRKQVET